MNVALRWAAASALAIASTASAARLAHPFYLGADLSSANEMQDCGAVLRQGGKPVDPFRLLKAKGGNLVRVRIWNDAKWTRYSGLSDVEKTIRRARQAGLQVLLDFHYSDDWADGDKQLVPAAWAALDTAGRAKALHDYTADTLAALGAKRLSPDMVQVGNETNGQLLGGKAGDIDWSVNARLFNAGIQAVREAAAAQHRPIRIMLHIPQPENAEPWFAAAKAAGVAGYDVIGLSYYRKWSKEDMSGLAGTIERLRAAYGHDVVVVETAYPYSLTASGDTSANLLGPDSVDPAYPASPKGQRDYMIALTRTVARSGGSGVVYWEPAWISTKCTTRWGTGSSWENATWFDADRNWEALPVLDFLGQRYLPNSRASRRR